MHSRCIHRATYLLLCQCVCVRAVRRRIISVKANATQFTCTPGRTSFHDCWTADEYTMQIPFDVTSVYRAEIYRPTVNEYWLFRCRWIKSKIVKTKDVCLQSLLLGWVSLETRHHTMGCITYESVVQLVVVLWRTADNIIGCGLKSADVRVWDFYNLIVHDIWFEQ
jgi:hypothetical protein